MAELTPRTTPAATSPCCSSGRTAEAPSSQTASSTSPPTGLAEAARVLRPGGRFAVSDVIADADMDEETRGDLRQWTGLHRRRLTEDEFRSALSAAGLVDVEVRLTHSVHERVSSAIVRARKLGG